MAAIGTSSARSQRPAARSSPTPRRRMRDVGAPGGREPGPRQRPGRAHRAPTSPSSSASSVRTWRCCAQADRVRELAGVDGVVDPRVDCPPSSPPSRSRSTSTRRRARRQARVTCAAPRRRCCRASRSAACSSSRRSSTSSCRAPRASGRTSTSVRNLVIDRPERRPRTASATSPTCASSHDPAVIKREAGLASTGRRRRTVSGRSSTRWPPTSRRGSQR